MQTQRRHILRLFAQLDALHQQLRRVDARHAGNAIFNRHAAQAEARAHRVAAMGRRGDNQADFAGIEQLGQLIRILAGARHGLRADIVVVEPVRRASRLS